MENSQESKRLAEGGPRLQILEGKGQAPASFRRVRVRLPVALDPREGVALLFADGSEHQLLREGPCDYHGTLDRALVGKRYRVVRTPGDVAEAGFSGQWVPDRVLEDVDEALWIYPVTWRDRPGEGRRFSRPARERAFTVAGRTIRIRLPEAADSQPDRRFPMVLALDGQNLFDPSTAYGGVDWALDRVTQRLERVANMPCVVVGVDHAGTERVHEYTCARDVGERAGGGAAAHLDWLLARVLPVVRHRYPVSDRAPVLIGSSLGGHFGLYAALAHPEAFSGIAAMSPSIGWGNEALLRVRPRNGTRPRIWMDMGSHESRVVQWAFQAIRGKLRRQGWVEGEDLRSLLVPAAAHHESAWSSRLHSALRFLLQEPDSETEGLHLV